MRFLVSEAPLYRDSVLPQLRRSHCHDKDSETDLKRKRKCLFRGFTRLQGSPAPFDGLEMGYKPSGKSAYRGEGAWFLLNEGGPHAEKSVGGWSYLH